jgi:hypothetical protein
VAYRFPYEEDGEDGYIERSLRPKGCRGKIHMRGVWGVRPCPRSTPINASSSIQDLVSLYTQLKDFMDEQAKINKDAVTKFEAMKKVLENLYGKVMEVGSSIR